MVLASALCSIAVRGCRCAVPLISCNFKRASIRKREEEEDDSGWKSGGGGKKCQKNCTYIFSKILRGRKY